MRLAYICMDPGVPVFGNKGCSIHAQEMLRFFVRAGFDVTVYAASTGGEPPAGLGSVRVHHMPIEGQDREEREQSAVRRNEDVLQQLLADGPFDLVYERYALFSFAGMRYAHGQRIAGALEVNAPLVAEQTAHRELHDRSSAVRITEDVYRSAPTVVAVSDKVRDHVIEMVGRREHLHVVPNGVDVDRFAPQQPAESSSPQPFTIGFVGSLKPWHGVHHLLDAFRLVVNLIPDARLVIVGDGPEREHLHEQTEALGLADAVDFTGSVAHEHVPSLMSGMHAAAAPYVSGEACYFSPLKIFEYMAGGVPVVAGRAGQIADIVENGVTGLLIPPGNVAALTGALLTLQGDPRLAYRIARNARERVVSEHTWEAVGRRVLRTAGVTPPSDIRRAA